MNATTYNLSSRPRPLCKCQRHPATEPTGLCTVCLDIDAMHREREAKTGAISPFAADRGAEYAWQSGAIVCSDPGEDAERALRFFAPASSIATSARQQSQTPPRSFRTRLLHSMFGPRSDQFWTAILLLGIAACMVGLVWPNLKHLGEGMATHSLIGWEVEKP